VKWRAFWVFGIINEAAVDAEAGGCGSDDALGLGRRSSGRRIRKAMEINGRVRVMTCHS
jgi:hypothetical protein